MKLAAWLRQNPSKKKFGTKSNSDRSHLDEYEKEKLSSRLPASLSIFICSPLSKFDFYTKEFFNHCR